MPRIKVRYLGRIREITGRHEEIILFDGKSLAELLDHLVSVYGDHLSRALFDDSGGNLRADIIILVNRKPVGDNLSVHLHDNYVVSILPFVSGG